MYGRCLYTELMDYMAELRLFGVNSRIYTL